MVMSVMPRIVIMVSGLLMVCLVCALVMSDEPPSKQEAAPQAKKAEAKEEETKTRDEKGKKGKAKAPTGYEDAPEAGDPPPPQDLAVPFLPAAEFVVVEAMNPEDLANVGDDFAKILAAKVDATVASLEKQLKPQIAPLLTAELSFINRACDLNLEQRKQIKAASDTCLQGAARKYAMTQRGMMLAGARRGPQAIPDLTVLLHQALTKVLQETLRPEQQTAYDGEMAKRKAYRKRVTIENVIAIIDERLVLTIDQRQQLAESLDKNWQPSWVQSIEMLMNNNRYLPSIPDQVIVPTLNDTQKQVWRSSQKHNYTTFGVVNWGQQAGAVDDFPLVDTKADIERASAN